MKTLSLLIKPASGLCNLRCKYCFYHDLEQHGAGGFGLMDRETADCLIRRATEETEKHIQFNFQGGEPTLAGLDFFRHFVEETEKRKRPGQTVSWAIQTNGMVLDGAWAAFLREKGFLVGLSLDGPKEYHDALRPDPAGKGTYSREERSWRLLRSSGVETNLLTVVSRNTARHAAQVYGHLKKLGANYLQFIACLDPLDAERGGEGHSLSPERYGRFLCELFDCWLRDYAAGNYVSVRQFDDWVHNLAGMPVSTCMSTGHCGAYLVIEADGSAYPCDFYVTAERKLGMIQDTPLEELMERGEPFLRESLTLPETCQSCPYLAACKGGCRRDRLFREGVPTENYFCEAYRTLCDHAWDKMCAIAQRERLAAQGR